MPLTKADMAHMSCQACAEEGTECCTHSTALWIHSQCHQTSPTWTVYDQGVLTVRCSVCDEPIASFEVAP